ncbi:MAG: TolC family protein [Pseudomonadota bacterium]
MGQNGIRAAAVLAAGMGLSACVGEDPMGAGFVSRLAGPTAAPEAEAAAFAGTDTTYDAKLSAESPVIQGLMARRSVLPSGSSYDRVAGAVLAANSRAAESELRAARLRAEAASKNWLPTLGPQISLTSLSSIVANIVVDQVLFDNGRKKGERAFAKADVEVAAVALSADTNDRVADALGLYLSAAEGRESAALEAGVLKDMQHFEYIMSERVKGGVSDMSDLNIIRAKLAEIRARRDAAAEAERTALAELNAMAAEPLDAVRGVPELAVSVAAAQPLTVTKAGAEKTRAIAEAQIERGGSLPGVSIGGTIGEGSTLGLNVGGAQLGLGTPARLRAIEETKEAAARQVAQATEDASRTLARLDSQLAAKRRQAAEAQGLTAQAKANLDLFQQQYGAGRRQVMDVVGVYETFAARQAAEIRLKYEAKRLEVEIARLQGVLAEGTAI